MGQPRQQHARVTIPYRRGAFQEATQTSGFAAEIAARVADRAIDRLDAPIRRVTYPDHPVPFHKILEKAALPSVEKIVAEAESVCSW